MGSTGKAQSPYARARSLETPKAFGAKRQQPLALVSSGVGAQLVLALAGHHPAWSKPCPHPHPGHSRQQGLGAIVHLVLILPHPGDSPGTLLLGAEDSATAASHAAS